MSAQVPSTRVPLKTSGQGVYPTIYRNTPLHATIGELKAGIAVRAKPEQRWRNHSRDELSEPWRALALARAAGV